LFKSEQRSQPGATGYIRQGKREFIAEAQLQPKKAEEAGPQSTVVRRKSSEEKEVFHGEPFSTPAQACTFTDHNFAGLHSQGD
jgi:hypothetical protein